MVSLRKSLNEIEKWGELARAGLGSLDGVLLTLRNHSPEIDAPATERLRQFLARSQESLRGTPTCEAVRGVRDGFEQEWNAYAVASLEQYQKTCHELCVTVQALSEALTGPGHEQAGGAEHRLRGEVDHLSRLARLPDAAQCQLGVRESVRRLHDCLEDLRTERLALTSQLRDEIRTLQDHLAQSEQSARTDAISGLANRREIERLLGAALEMREPFCIVYVWLSNYKALEREMARRRADQLVAAVASAMRAMLPAQTAVGRWSDDEFHILLGGDKTGAIRTSRDLATRLNAGFALGEAESPVRLRCSVGIIDPLPGERAEALLRRGDSLIQAIQQR